MLDTDSIDDLWTALIGPVAQGLHPQNILLIDPRSEALVQRFLQYSQRNQATLNVTYPPPALVPRWQKAYDDCLVVYPQEHWRSPFFFNDSDLVVLGHDPNWFKVLRDLEFLSLWANQWSQSFPVVLIHGVGWPYGRRDRYEAPASIPQHSLLPNRKGGVFPGVAGLLDSGGLFQNGFHARQEGGSRNGVLTAVEDFIAHGDHPPLSFFMIPSHHGLGMLYPTTLTQRCPEMQAVLRRIRPNAKQFQALQHAETKRIQALLKQEKTAPLRLQLTQAPIRIALKVSCPPQRHWGEFSYGLRLQKALEKKGYQVRCDFLPFWYSHQCEQDDVVLVLRGYTKYTANPNQINLEWIISAPFLEGYKELNQFDHLFVASDLYVQQLNARPMVKGPVSALHQCVDPETFPPRPVNYKNQDPRCLLIGNNHFFKPNRYLRPVIADALQAGVPLRVIGKQWDALEGADFLEDKTIPNYQIHEYYRRHQIVLNDHLPSMRELGFINNRIFDVFSTGGFVITDPVPGLQDLLGDAVVTYRTPRELRHLVHTYQRDVGERQRRTQAVQKIILNRHTFDHRAETIHRVIQSLLQRKGIQRERLGV